MNRKTILQVLFIVVFLLSTRDALSQVDSVYEAWVARYNGSGGSVDWAEALVSDGSGNVYVTGRSGFYPTGNYVTIKYDTTGSEQWVARYNGLGNGDDAATAIAIDGSGNLYVTGSSYGSGTYSDYATIKYNASGVQQWVARYSGPTVNSYDAAKALTVDVIGNVYVTGSSPGIGTLSDYATIKYDASGVQQWVARYSGPAYDYNSAKALAVDASGNVYVTGYSPGSGTSGDYATIKYNSTGVQQWVARYNGPGNFVDDAYSLAVDASGNVYVTGTSSGSGTFGDYATVKYDASGVQQWVARYNGPGNYTDYALALAVDVSGNVYVTGQSYGSGTLQDFITIKYDASGVQQWAACYNGPGNSYDTANAIAVDASGNVYVTGSSTALANPYQDYATIKYDPFGVEQWVVHYDNESGLGNDVAQALAVDGSGNVYVTGSSDGAGTSQDYTTIKYHQTSSVVSVSVMLNSPAGEGSFDYDLTFTNNTDSSLTVDIWTEMFGPGEGHKIGNIITGRTLQGNWSYSESGSAGVGEGAPEGDYTFRVNVGQYPDVVMGSGSATYTKTGLEKEGAELRRAVPTTLELFQNHPNPFNPSTTIRYGIPEKAHVRLEVFNTLGQSVAVLVNNEQEAGYHSAVFEGSELASGVYVYRLTTETFVQTKRLLLLR